MHPPHPHLTIERYEGRAEIWLADFRRPIGRCERLSDGTWVAAVRPVQSGPEKAVIVASGREALQRLTPWCRRYAWLHRPNTQCAMPGAPGAAQQPRREVD